MPNYELLESVYGDDVPSYIIANSKTSLTINVNDWQGKQEVKINIKDLIKYYVEQAPNISSGLRCIAGLYGDWRNIDELAKEALAYFKANNIDELKREAKRQGLEPKF